MSEVVVRMKMPTGCAECDLVDESDRCVLLGTFAGDKSARISKCPIIGVLPEKHGDLIDRDELLKHKGNCYDFDGHLLYAVGTGSILQMKTVIAATERNET